MPTCMTVFLYRYHAAAVGHLTEAFTAVAESITALCQQKQASHDEDLETFTCPICQNEEDVDGAFTPDCDAHRFCFECVVGHVRSKVNAMSATSDERVTCPLCPVELSPHQVGGLQRPRLLGKSSHVYLVFEEVTSGSEWGGLLRSPTHSNASSPMHNGKFLFKNM